MFSATVNPNHLKKKIMKLSLIFDGFMNDLQEMEDPTTFFPQYQMMNPIDYSFDDLSFQSFSSESYNSSYPNIDQKISPNVSCNIEVSHHQLVDEHGFKRPTKQLKTNNWNNSCITENIPPKPSSSSNSHIISFDNSNSSPPPAISQQYYGVQPKNEVGTNWDGNIDHGMF